MNILRFMLINKFLFIIFQKLGVRLFSKSLDNHADILYNIIVIMTFCAHVHPRIFNGSNAPNKARGKHTRKLSPNTLGKAEWDRRRRSEAEFLADKTRSIKSCCCQGNGDTGCHLSQEVIHKQKTYWRKKQWIIQKHPRTNGCTLLLP